MNGITVLILAGGEGRRMGGEDKGLVLFQGSPLIEHVLRGLRAQTSLHNDRRIVSIIISANRNHERYAEYADAVVSDEVLDTEDGFEGPLVGIAAALSLNAIQTPLVLTLPCDAVQFPSDLIERLFAAINDSTSIGIAATGAQAQPMFCLFKTAIAASAIQAVEAGERSVLRWAQAQAYVLVDLGAAEVFRNVNSLDGNG
jgi:molybdenum cofactor guanylyltransferase